MCIGIWLAEVDDRSRKLTLGYDAYLIHLLSFDGLGLFPEQGLDIQELAHLISS